MSRFPHLGFPIAPRLLRPVLSIGLPRAFTRLVGRFSALADLDETVWDYVDQSVADILGNLVITRASQMRSAPFWRLTYFPELTEGRQLNEVLIEQPTYECLSDAFKGKFTGGLPSLAQYTLDHLMSNIPGFGIRPLVDILTVVHLDLKDNSVPGDASERLDLNQLRSIIRTPGSWRSYSAKYLPALPKTANLEELRLSVRAQNCVQNLLKECVISNLADLSHLTIGQIMERANFGLKSLIDLLTELQPLVLESAPVLPSPQCAAVSLKVEASLAQGDGEFSDQLSIDDIQQIISQSRPLDLFFERRVPNIPSATTLADMRLDARTYNCITELINGAIISSPSDLSRMTIRKLMRTKNFGRKSLANLLRSIEQLQEPHYSATKEALRAAPKLSCPELTRAAEKLVQSGIAGRIRCGDSRVSELCGDLLYTANNSGDYPPLDSNATLQQVALRLAACTYNLETASRVMSAIRQLRLRLAELMRMKLETELRSLATIYLTGRDLEMVLALFGWAGDLPRTLQSVGDSFGLTRERVRQIASKFERVYRRRKAFVPTLERVIRFISRRVPTVADDIEEELQSRGLTLTRFRVESIIECAKHLGQPVPFVLDESRQARVITEARRTGLTRLIASHARRAVSKYGLANAVEIKEQLTDTVHSGIDLKFLNNVIRAMGSYEDLGNDWFWLQDLPRNHLLTIVRKVLAVAPRIHVSEMRAAIANDPRGMGFAPPKQVVLRFCESAVGCDVEDEMIMAGEKQDLLRVLSQTEQVIVDVFQVHGPILSLRALEDYCVKRGVKRTTSSLYAGRLAIMARYAPGLYGLRGASFTEDDLDRATPRRQVRYSDHGWTVKAEPWAAIELAPSVLSSGVVQLPLGLRQQLRGRYVLKSEDGQKIGQLAISDNATWGLSPLFRRRGGEPGDILLLTFDLRRHEVTAKVGDLAVVPELGTLAEEVRD